MLSSPRSGKTLSPHELVRFLNLLSQTGNFALACSTLGRSKSGLYKRRLRDSLFDSECVAALATFRMENPSLHFVMNSSTVTRSPSAAIPSSLTARWNL